MCNSFGFNDHNSCNCGCNKDKFESCGCNNESKGCDCNKGCGCGKEACAPKTRYFCQRECIKRWYKVEPCGTTCC